MHAKKIISAALTAAMLLSGTCTAGIPQTAIYAKDDIRFYTGLGYYEHMGLKSTKISSIKVPKGSGTNIYSKDSKESGAPRTQKQPALKRCTKTWAGLSMG